MKSPVTDKHKEHWDSRALGFSYFTLQFYGDQSDFGWRDMAWDRRLRKNDFVSAFIRTEAGFRVVRNKS